MKTAAHLSSRPPILNRKGEIQLVLKMLITEENSALHDREIRLDNGWVVKIGRGFDIYQKPGDWFEIGSNDLDLRPCLETTEDIFKAG